MLLVLRKLLQRLVTAEEQLRRLIIINRAFHLKISYQHIRLKNTLDDLESFNMLYFTQSSSLCYKNLLNQKIRIGTKIYELQQLHCQLRHFGTRSRRDCMQVPCD